METGFENPTLRISLFCTLASFQASLNFPKKLPLSYDWCISGDSAELVSSHYPAVQCLWFSLMVVPFDHSLLAPNLLAMLKKNGECIWDWKPCKLSRVQDSKGGFPAGSESKEFAYNAGDLGSIPRSGRSPEERNGTPFQYSWLENPMNRGAWWTTVHGVAKNQTSLNN